MPWFTCSRCRIRRSGLDVAISAANDRCPLCGRPLEAESDVASLMGSRFLANDVLSASLPSTKARTADADALAGDRWLDEGGSSEPGAGSR